MNYIKEMNAFYDWLEFNEVTPSAVNLWHALMHINNKARWAESFTVAESVLSTKTGLPGRTVRSARAELKKLGRLDFVSVNGKAPVYTIVSLLGLEEARTVFRADPIAASAADPTAEDRAGDSTGDSAGLERSAKRAAFSAGGTADLAAAVGAGVHGESERSAKCIAFSADGAAGPIAGVAATLSKQNKKKQNKTEQQRQEAVDDGFAMLATFYEQNIGPLTPHVGEMLSHLEAESGAALTRFALEKAVEADAGSKVKYAEAVLRSWKSRNMTTVEQVKQMEKRRSGGKRQSLFTISEETMERQKSTAKHYQGKDMDVAAFPF